MLRRSTNSSGTTLTVYAFGLEEHVYSSSGSNQGNTYYYTLGGQLLGKSDGGSTSFYQTDLLGSVVADWSNTAGSAALKGNEVYGPYGKERYNQGTHGTAKGFTGQYSDSVSGLDYYNTRYYDPKAGVFLSADTRQGNGAGMDPYSYVGGNPETYIDPTGERPVSAGPGTSAPDTSPTSNPLTWPKLEVPPETPAVAAACFLFCPVELVIAGLLAVGLFLATPQIAYTGDYTVPVITAPFRSRTSAEVYGNWSTGGATARSIQPHHNTPPAPSAPYTPYIPYQNTPLPQAGGGGRGIQPPRPVAAAGGSCSFTSDTPITTKQGEQVISKLHVGDKVLAYNPKTHKMELQPILHVWKHTDNDLIDLTITTTLAQHGKPARHKTEVMHTTTEHPFFTTEQGFVGAGKVKRGMHVLRADGSVGVITGWKLIHGTKVMYNLEVAQDHTFTVGEGQWVVHNECVPDGAKTPRSLYHYTSEAGLVGILQSDFLNPSLEEPNITFGKGQYLTDIAPEQIIGRVKADLTQDELDQGYISFSQLARRLYGQPWGLAGRLRAFIEINVTGLSVENPAPNIFRIPGTEPLDLSGRIIRFGATPWSP